MPGVPRDGPVPGWVACGGSLAALAGRIGVPPEALAATVRRWNHACAEGADRDFGRGEGAYERFCGDPAARPNPSLGPLDEAPYYAVEVLAGTIGTKGGPVTDADGAVLDLAGAPCRACTRPATPRPSGPPTDTRAPARRWPWA